MLRRLIGEDVELRLTLDAQRPHAIVDPGQIEQLLLNLAVNARDAMPTGGRLTVATSDVALDEKDHPARTDLRPGRYVLTTITDTGTGIPAEIRERISSLLHHQGSRQGHGPRPVHGLRHRPAERGSDRARQPAHGGTAFRVYLPSVDCPVDTWLPPAAVVPRRNDVPPRSVLLVEDDAALRRVMTDILEAEGYRVMALPDGTQALARLTSGTEPVDSSSRTWSCPGSAGASWPNASRPCGRRRAYSSPPGIPPIPSFGTAWGGTRQASPEALQRRGAGCSRARGA